MKALLLGDFSPANITSLLIEQKDIETLFGDSVSLFPCGQGDFHFVKSNNYPDTWSNSLAVKYDTKANKIDFIPLICTYNGIILANGDEENVKAITG